MYGVKLHTKISTLNNACTVVGGSSIQNYVLQSQVASIWIELCRK